MTPTRNGIWLLVGLMAGGLPAGWSAEPNLKKGVIDPSYRDMDIVLQGEYTGSVCWQGCYQNMGLQVVALGEGRFAGLMYRGGLPGNGYSGGTTWPLTGQRQDQVLTLKGENLVLTLQAGYAVVVDDAQGHRCGYLQPLHRYSLRAGAPPPPGAVVLFDGRNTQRLKNAKVSENGLLQVGTETVDSFRDFFLHVEFKLPYMPLARGQGRGNSGVYLQKRYEVQVLDSFGLEPQVDGAASLYKFKPPDLNMSFPPLTWQTYDIDFQAARFDDQGVKTAPARITVWHNGVIVHHQVALANKTGGGSPEGPHPLPILLQNHGNPVEYRNVWILERSWGGTSLAACDRR